VFLYLPDDPTRARFFNDRERYVALERVRENNAGVVNHRIKWTHIKEALLDPTSWLYMTIVFGGVTPNGVTGTFSSLIIKSLGFNNLQALALQAPQGFFAFLATIIPTYVMRRYKNVRFLCLTVACSITLVGAVLLWAVPKSNTGAVLAGYCILLMLLC
jgi:MFS transporter, ACS family, allantoate permease